jgi:hypothetical protein
MATENNQEDNQSTTDKNKVNITESQSRDDKNKLPNQSGDPGRTPGSAEGDEETVDQDIRQKESEGKL